MIRETHFVFSHHPFAVDLASAYQLYEIKPDDQFRWVAVRAVWYRRKERITYACTGYLHDLVPVDQDVSNVPAFLIQHTDGRYGGACEGRWDGTRYWGAQEPDVMETHLTLLRLMVDNFPVIPDGYDGWWTFRRVK